MRALIVDDSRATRLFVRSLLGEFGIGAIEAGDGEQALARLAESPGIDLVLIDWNMPTLDGIGLVRRIRADSALAPLKLLMITSESDVGRVAEALQCGADEYLMKPFDKQMLAEKLQMVGLEVG